VHRRKGSGALVHKVYEPPRLDRGEVDVIGDAISTGDADGEPAGAGAEFRLALGQSAEAIGLGDFGHSDRRLRNRRLDTELRAAPPHWQLGGTLEQNRRPLDRLIIGVHVRHRPITLAREHL
jgi:hypothetical protein